MFDPNDDKPAPIQQSHGPLLSPADLIHPPGDKKNSTLEIETDSKNNNDDDLNHYISECQRKVYKWDEFSGLVDSINSEDQFKRFYGLIGIRKLLNNGPIDENQVQKVIEAGLLSKLVEFMKKDDDLQLQVEATWALVGFTTGTSDQVKQIIEQGAIPMLVRLLNSCHAGLVENATMALGNIACEPHGRDVLLDHGALYPLIEVLNQALDKKDNTLIKQGSNALSYLLKGDPLPDYERVVDAIPVLCCVIQEVSDVQVLKYALWALYHHSDEEEEVARVLETDSIVPSLIRCLDYRDAVVLIPTLRVLGNIAKSDDHAEAVLKVSSTRSYMKKLFQLLKTRSDQPKIRSEVCWTLANIACQRDFIDLIIGNPEYVEQLTNVALYDDFFKVKEEALWTFSNAAAWGSKNQLMAIVRNGVFDCMCKSIQQDQPNDFIILLGLTGIKKILAVSTMMSRKHGTNNICLIKLKPKRILDRMKKSKESQDERLSELAVEVLNKYLKGHLLKKNLRLKKMIICFRNEKRHARFGLFLNKKKKLCV